MPPKHFRIVDVQFTEAALSRHYFEETNNVGGATNCESLDRYPGNQAFFQNEVYADFAQKTPAGKVRGLLTKFGSIISLLFRKMADCAKNSPFFSQVSKRWYVHQPLVKGGRNAQSSGQFSCHKHPTKRST
jgi:hypothetical protein